jgi:hypothetical protein
LNPLTLVREGRRAVFVMPLQQDAEVFVHLSVDVLQEQVSMGVSTFVGG